MDKDPTSNGTTAPAPVAGALGRLLLGGLAVGEQILTIPVERSEQVAAAPGTLPPPSARHLVIGALLHGRAGLGRARPRVPRRAARGGGGAPSHPGRGTGLHQSGARRDRRQPRGALGGARAELGT